MSSAVPQTLRPTKRGSALYGLPEGQEARFLADKARSLMADNGVVTYLVVDAHRMSLLQQQLAFFAPDVDVCVLPPWDCLPYDRVSPSPDISAARVAALATLLDWQTDITRKPRLFLTTAASWGQRVVQPDVLRVESLSLQKGKRLAEAHIKGFLAHNGYHRTDTVREAGEFAIRGSIIDLFPAGQDAPVRIDLFGDEIDSLKSFDPATQVSTGNINTLKLLPAAEFSLSDAAIARFRTGYRDLFGMPAADDPLYAAVSEGRKATGMEHWLPLFYDGMAHVADYLPSYQLFAEHSAMAAQPDRLAQISDFYLARKTLEAAGKARKSAKKGNDVSLSGAMYHPLPPEKLYDMEAEWAVWQEQLNEVFATQSPNAEDAPYAARRGRDFADVRALPQGDVYKALAETVSLLRQGGERRIVLAAYSDGARERLLAMLEAAGFANMVKIDDAGGLKKLLPQQLGLIILPLERGFVASDLAIITEQDLLGDRLVRSQKKKGKADNFLREVSSLQAGDLVVHAEHGIGRFEGLETLKAGGVFHDCLKLVYDGGDKLFVPVENIEVLTRFGSDEGTVALDKLGGAGWQARKARVKKDLLIMAEGLLAIAAARHLRESERLQVDDTVYHDFVSRFPYHETEDQLKSINDVLDDLSKGQPMDRLVCGDVGFGKTEVALRAAYVAAMAGAQVAILAPTTLLARQHANTFAARFANTPLKIASLSRLVSAADQKRAKDDIAEGRVDIIVGTHAILSQGVKFKRLGLLIVDEEQKFGVKQKERLKELKNNVHVLTLTATPIPRTLQMALTGVRDLSLITTPPVDRLAIRTSVLPYDPLVIREAILREHYRGGQTFYVCPRIADLDELEKQLDELVPEVKRITAHGQMTPTELEDRMSAFYDGQYGVLLATNIIESGLDIPTANTIIVHRSDMFGLSQLYQMRGRVGRSKARAYAYLTYPAGQKLTPTAQKRLEVLETLDTLGAGFQLASHDMDIRGAGNLLGEEQSGHVREVGVELYQQMLEEAVAAAKAGIDSADMAAIGQADWSPQINLGTSVLIPEDYVPDLSVRMSLYRRLADLADNAGVETFAAELIDRFGKVPAEVENLLDIMKIKQQCKALGISKIEAGPKGAVIGFHNDAPPSPDKLLVWIASKRGLIKIRPDQKLTFMGVWDTADQRVRAIKGLLKDLSAALQV